MKSIWKMQLDYLSVLIKQRLEEIQYSLMNESDDFNEPLLRNFDFTFINNSLVEPISKEETFIIFLALVPNLQPGFFDSIISNIFPQGTELPELGGIKGTNHRGFIPTGETAVFLLAGFNIECRFRMMTLFNNDGKLNNNDIVHLETVKDGEPFLSGRIILNNDILEKIILNREVKPSFTKDFPAKILSTNLNWDSLIVSRSTMNEIDTIEKWLNFNDDLINDWNLHEKIKKGYRALFYGPPGTGKTFTAALLGKKFDKDVYRIDLSLVVSKYIGETEKNLEKIFTKGENKKWILFFDEADALFGKRSSISSSHDRYANQETSYLLQRVEDYNGMVILASNVKSNIDDAFMRRFNSIVNFPLPNALERVQLYKVYLPKNHLLSNNNIETLAKGYEISGALILNAIHHASLNSFSINKFLEFDDLVNSIKREYSKEERLVV